MDRVAASKQLARAYLIVPAAVLVYAVVLHEVYLGIVLPNFAYVGYRYIDTEITIDVISWLATTIVALILPRQPRAVSNVILWVLFVVVVAPTMLMLPYLGPANPWDGLLLSVGLGAALIASVLVSWRRKEIKAPLFSVSPTTVWLICGLFSVVTYGYIALTVGLNFEYISIYDVYDTRSDYREALAEATLLGYLVSTQANVVNPLAIAVGFRDRRWSLIGVATLGQLILYTGTGFKTVLFSLVAIAVFVVLFKVVKNPRLLVLLWGASGLLLVAWLIDVLMDSFVWTSIFGRRFLYTPARLTGLYFDWYSNNPWSMLGNSVLSTWVETDYQYGPSRTIAIYATGESVASLNANVFASGFAEFGVYGMFGVAILLGIYLRVLDRVSSGLPLWFSAIVVVMPAVTLSNTAFQTSLLSHGLVAAVLLLAIVPRDISLGRVSGDRLSIRDESRRGPEGRRQLLVDRCSAKRSVTHAS